MNENKVSIPFIEQSDGSFKISEETLSPSIILNLKLNSNKIIKIKELIELGILTKEILENLNIKEDDFVIPSEILTNSISRLIKGYQENSSGNAGNISLAYQTLKLPNNLNFLLKKHYDKINQKIKTGDFKIITSELKKSIDVLSIDLIFQDYKSGKTIKIKIDLTIEIDKIIENFLSKNYKPYRIQFHSINFLNFIQFYLKPINSKFVKIQNEYIINYLNYNYPDYSILKMNKTELINTFKDKVTFLTTLSNEKFIVIKNKTTGELKLIIENNLIRIFRVSEYLTNGPCSPLEFHLPKLYSIGSLTLLNQPINASQDISIKIDFIRNVLNSKYKLKDSQFLETVDVFLKENMPDLNKNILKLFNEISTPNYYIQDELNINFLKDKNNFKLFHPFEKEVDSENSFINTSILIKREKISNISFFIYDRKNKINSNEMNDILFFNLYKSDFSFEREKLASIIFIENFCSFLKKTGFVDIKIYLEKPCNKLNSFNNGFLDFHIEATKDNTIYEDYFEFKAIHSISSNELADMILQANSYGVIPNHKRLTKLIKIDKENTVDCLSFNKVIPINLIGDINNYLFELNL